jgi:hypothetical protein
VEDIVEAAVQQTDHMPRVAGCTNGDHGGHVRQLPGCRQSRGAPEAMPDQDPRRMARLLHRPDGGCQVGDVAAEGGMGEVAFALPQPGEVKAKDADPPGGERPRDPHRRHRVLAARKTMGKNGVGGRGSVRQVEPARQALPLGAREVENFRPYGHCYG